MRRHVVAVHAFTHWRLAASERAIFTRVAKGENGSDVLQVRVVMSTQYLAAASTSAALVRICWLIFKSFMLSIRALGNTSFGCGIPCCTNDFVLSLCLSSRVACLWVLAICRHWRLCATVIPSICHEVKRLPSGFGALCVNLCCVHHVFIVGRKLSTESCMKCAGGERK